MKNRKNYLKARKKQFKWKVIGWWSSKSVCSKCGQKTIYLIYRYDAWCCISCNEWQEEICFDPNCPFCSKRPETPYEAYFLSDIEIGSADEKKLWRRKNYQHKTDGMRKHKKHRETIVAQREAERTDWRYRAGAGKAADFGRLECGRGIIT